MAQNGKNDLFGQNGLILHWILAFASPKWTKLVHVGPFFLVHSGPPTVSLATPNKWWFPNAAVELWEDQIPPPLFTSIGSAPESIEPITASHCEVKERLVQRKLGSLRCHNPGPE